MMLQRILRANCPEMDPMSEADAQPLLGGGLRDQRFAVPRTLESCNELKRKIRFVTIDATLRNVAQQVGPQALGASWVRSSPEIPEPHLQIGSLTWSNVVYARAYPGVGDEFVTLANSVLRLIQENAR
jgi:hypothetical protein